MAMTQTTQVRIDPDALREVWPVLDADERAEGFGLLRRAEAEEFFLELSPRAQADIVLRLSDPERRLWMRLLAPDDAADLLQQVPPEERQRLLALLDPTSRAEVSALLAYAEDDAGGLMSPRFARVRPDMTLDEAIGYLRRQARQNLETISYIYVLDQDQRLLGVVSFRELFTAPPGTRVADIMRRDVVSVPEDMDQEAVAKVLADEDLVAVPVVDQDGRIRGIVTADDIVDVVLEEATEDIQKLGGMEALDVPYLQTPFWSLIRKRAGWLAVLFVGGMFTTNALAFYEDALARAIVLTVFIPLIIASGGNSGSQAATLVTRAMALGQVRLRDWWRIMRREAASGLTLGAILAAVGILRIELGATVFQEFGPHHAPLALTIGISLISVVLWGTIIGSMLPFIATRFGFDPASASAPLVATLVDVVGIVIYFTTAELILSGTLL
ncbi:MAG TPA: magnesium transporter [Thermoanaerobaculia bacterium]|nr:magnesium transporter [Thermoanaerobaculia bacterium]